MLKFESPGKKFENPWTREEAKWNDKFYSDENIVSIAKL